MGLLDFIKKRFKNNKAVFCGLDNAGKSTIISFLQHGKFVDHTPTMGKKNVDIKIKGLSINLFDMGGQEAFREFWLGAIKDTDLLVYVIDKSNKNRYEESAKEFAKLMPLISKSNTNILILANKHDLMEEENLVEIIKKFNLQNLKNFEIVNISAKTGYNMVEAFNKFYVLLTGNKLEKGKYATAISLYEHSGEPILSQMLEDHEINQKALEGGFLSAMTSFSNHKFGENNGNSVIKFESEEHGTFLVARSPHYIASILWTEDLGETIENSKDALLELLAHLEDSCPDPTERQKICQYSQHYMTNFM